MKTFLYLLLSLSYTKFHLYSSREQEETRQEKKEKVYK